MRDNWIDILSIQKRGNMANSIRANSKSHMPENSFLFEKVVPAILIFLGVVTLGLILFALSLLFGIVHL